jgi:hypothetical protein
VVRTGKEREKNQERGKIGRKREEKSGSVKETGGGKESQ